MQNVNLYHEYNVSERYKCLIWLPERTGSGTNAQIMTHYGFKTDSFPLIDGRVWRYSHHCGFPEKFEGYQLICTCRNPYSRVLSIYRALTGHPFQNRPNDKESFKNYLEWVYQKDDEELHHAYITNPRFNKKPDYLLRLENLYEDYLKIPFIHDIFSAKGIKTKLNWNKEIDEWESFYDQSMKDIVYDMCKLHFEIWGYDR